MEPKTSGIWSKFRNSTISARMMYSTAITGTT